MFGKKAIVSAVVLFLFLDLTVLFFSVKGKRSAPKAASSGQDIVQDGETNFAEQIIKGVVGGKEQVLPASTSTEQSQALSSPINKPSAQPGQPVQSESINRSGGELTAKMVNDFGFNGVFVPNGNSWEFKALLVKEPSDRQLKTLEIQLPRGWIFKPGGEIKQKEIVGRGKVFDLINNPHKEYPLYIQNIQAGENHIANWSMYFGKIEHPFGLIECYIDGDENSGFKLTLNKSVKSDGSNNTSRIEFSIFSEGEEESTVFSRLSDTGEKIKATVRFFDGTSEQIEN